MCIVKGREPQLLFWATSNRQTRERIVNFVSKFLMCVFIGRQELNAGHTPRRIAGRIAVMERNSRDQAR